MFLDVSMFLDANDLLPLLVLKVDRTSTKLPLRVEIVLAAIARPVKLFIVSFK